MTLVKVWAAAFELVAAHTKIKAIGALFMLIPRFFAIESDRLPYGTSPAFGSRFFFRPGQPRFS